MEELRPGLWTWTARHPEWPGPGDGWGPDVRSYAVDDGRTLVLLDPLSPPSLVDELAAGKLVAVLLTVADHERSAGELAERLGASVRAPAAGLGRLSVAASGYEPGDSLPGGVVATTAFWPNEATLWIPAHRALVTGDVLLGEPGLRLLPDDWIGDAATAEEVRAGLRPLLDLPLELVLPTHGDPVESGADALRRVVEG